MHKYLLLLAAAALTLPARAQTERGARLLGVSVGDLRYERYGNEGRRELSVAAYPTVGWFVADRLALGTGALLLYGRTKSAYDGLNARVKYTDHTVAFGAAPFLRYYLYNGSSHKLFGQVGGELAAYFGSTHTEEGPRRSTSHDSGTNFGYHVDLGYNYFLTPNVALEATAVYRRNSVFEYLPTRADASPRANSLDVRLGFSVFLAPKAAAPPAP